MTVDARLIRLEVWVAPPPTEADPDPALVRDWRAVAATCSFGFDQRYAEATVTRAGGVPAQYPESYPDAEIAYWSKIEIRMGVAGGNYAVRFAGWVIPVENALWPQEGVLHCRGYLYRAQWVKNQQAGGTDLAAPAGATDQAMVQAVLTACGVPYAPANIGGTGLTLGTLFTSWDDPLTPGAFAWADGEPGLSVVERLDAVSVPDDASGAYRTFETLGGDVFRIKLSATPAGTPDFSFTEGVDVLDARITRDPTGAGNRVVVTGAPLVAGGGPLGPLAQTFTASTAFAPYLPPGLPDGPDGFPSVGVAFASPLIEKSEVADPGDGVACEAVAQYLLLEHNCVVDTLEFSTPRDDLLGPGQTIHLHSPRLGITDPDQHYWLQHLDIEVDERGAFTQRLRCTRKS